MSQFDIKKISLMLHGAYNLENRIDGLLKINTTMEQ